jgi:hypothetical protein
MVFGIGEGKIEIILPKTNYSGGETIKGKLVLTLNQPKKAKGLRVELVARQKQKQRSHSAKGGDIITEVDVFRFPSQLKGEGDFSSSEYEFELKVPDVPGASPAPKLELIPGVLSIGAPSGYPMMWRVTASLDLPMSLDITKTVPITVSPKTQSP